MKTFPTIVNIQKSNDGYLVTAEWWYCMTTCWAKAPLKAIFNALGSVICFRLFGRTLWFN